MQAQICDLVTGAHAGVQRMHRLSKLPLYLRMEPCSQIFMKIFCSSGQTLNNVHYNNTNVAGIGARVPSDL